MATRSNRVMANFTRQLRTDLNAQQPVPRLKMGMGARIVRMLKRGSLGFCTILMLAVCVVSRMLASLLAEGKVGNILCIAFITIPLIVVANYLLDDTLKHE